MGDEEQLCSRCRDAAGPDDPLLAAPGAPAAGGVLTATRPVTSVADAPAPAIGIDEEALPVRGGRRPRGLVPVVVLVIALGAGLALGVAGSGPLADPMQRLGITEPSPVQVPGEWVPVRSDEGGFTAELPVGATAVDEEVASGALVGWDTAVGDGASVRVVSAPVDLAAGTSDDEIFASMVQFFIADSGAGEVTVLRDAPVATGRGADAVIVLDDSVTTRARFVQSDGRFHALLTRGPDEGGRALDEAHARLIESFDPVS